MDFSNVSDEIMILLEGEETIKFSRTSLKPSILPTEEQLQKKVWGIQLSYAFYGEQNFGITPLKKAFGAGVDGIIKKVPKEFVLETRGNVSILKYGTTRIIPEMINHVETFGMLGYWDDSNLIICCSEKYNKIIENVMDLIQNNKAKFALRTVFGGPNLMILSV